MRKTKYDTHVAPFLHEIGQMARNGATEEEIAGKLDVAYSTFREYRKKHEELKKALEITKEMADLDVEAALYKRANGYEYTETTREYDEETGKMRVTKTVVKQVAPDVSAQIFYLKNRRPELWRDKQHVEVGGLKEEQSKLAELLKQRRERRDGKC